MSLIRESNQSPGWRNSSSASSASSNASLTEESKNISPKHKNSHNELGFLWEPIFRWEINDKKLPHPESWIFLGSRLGSGLRLGAVRSEFWEFRGPKGSSADRAAGCEVTAEDKGRASPCSKAATFPRNSHRRREGSSPLPKKNLNLRRISVCG